MSAIAKKEGTGDRSSDIHFSAMHRFGTDSGNYVSDIDFMEYSYDNDGNVYFLSVFDVKEINRRFETESDIKSTINDQLGNNVKVYTALANELDIPGFVLFFHIKSGTFIAVSINEMCDCILEHLTNIPGDLFIDYPNLVDGKKTIAFFENNQKLNEYYKTIDKDSLNKIIKNDPYKLGLKTLNEFIIAFR